MKYATNDEFDAIFDEPLSDRGKPKCKLIGEDGNIFNLMGIANRALKKAGQLKQGKKMMAEIQRCGSYDEALAKIDEYVEVV